MSEVLYPLSDDLGSVALIQHAGDDKMIVNAARISFGGDSKMPLNAKDERLIRYLLRHRHGSPFEHNLITFKIACPVFVDRHLVKHRAGVSKNEESGRYVELEEEFYMPLEWRQQSEDNRQASVPAEQLPEWHAYNRNVMHEAYQAVWAAYRDLLERGVAREQARMVLPLGLYVGSYYTFNVRSLLHLLSLRDAPEAQYETQLYARALAQLAEPLFPVTFREWRALKGEKA